ncbi:MAG TPA: hydrogenase maturation nickel metallochaperone HypA [Desulfomonilia bacterium]|nr:hydrogenase maturation nickel metallochaperone HypA [Desulfomonilia bacterium]
MHEMSLTASIMDIISEYARVHGFTKVNSMRLSFGMLSCIEPKALEFAFEVLSKDTLAEGARLEYDIMPIVVTCLDCGSDSAVEEFPSLCPFCKTEDVVLKSGTEELRIVEMEVD